jgi:hypothetical protein
MRGSISTTGMKVGAKPNITRDNISKEKGTAGESTKIFKRK